MSDEMTRPDHKRDQPDLARKIAEVRRETIDACARAMGAFEADDGTEQVGDLSDYREWPKRLAERHREALAELWTDAKKEDER